MHGLFGTDGVRGIANDFLTCERAMQIGRAVGSLLSRKRRYHPLVLIGQDTRLSSEMLASAVAAGLCHRASIEEIEDVAKQHTHAFPRR